MFNNNKILILGFARSGYDAAKVLINRNNQVTIFDDKEKETHDQEKIVELTNLGVNFIFGSLPDNLLDPSYNYLIKNPGVPIDHPLAIQANSLGIELINEAEMAFRLFKGKVKLIGVTGTNGKTTTTTLIYEVLKAAKLPVHITGNIGFPLCGFLNIINQDDIIVMEVSSQQLENFKEFNPDIAVLTNLSPAHIDFFKTYEYYQNTKAKIFQNQTSNNLAVLNYNDEDTKKIIPKIKSEVIYFSTTNNEAKCHLENNVIYYNNKEVIKTNQIKIMGQHNYENIMAMILVVKNFNVDNEIIINVLRDFNGVPHRLEYVKELNSRVFYNDSKATNIESTKIAVLSFSQPTILLMGGMERNQDFNELNKVMKNVRLVVCYGQNKERIKAWLNAIKIETIVCENIVDATKIAYEKSNVNEVILLSPASASWDQFDCFESRGDLYKETVNQLN